MARSGYAGRYAGVINVFIKLFVVFFKKKVII